jgi:diadenosine tetraphosphate (Ap4A) HIT family hydrolase/8-oxo-dGTP pyrophosphatase MutT (NUDIX family)
MDISQEQMRTARTSGSYDQIWQNTGKCVFCDLKDKYIIREENGIVLTISLYPYIDGHLMAIPRRHVQSPKELSSKEWETMRKFNYLAKKLVRKAHGIKSLWTVLREGGVKADMSVASHLHMHYVPVDNKDLATWNYRELKLTPLENAQKYQQLLPKIEKYAAKFSEKYGFQGMLPIVVGAIILNSKDELLLQERNPKYAIDGRLLVLPGGHVDAAVTDLRSELVRELEEELGVQPKLEELKLVDSSIENLNFATGYNQTVTERFVYNTYLWRTELSKKSFKIVSAESLKLIWVKLKDLEKVAGTNPDLITAVKKAL